MLNQMLNKKVLLEKTCEAMASVTKDIIYRNIIKQNDRSVSAVIVYTNPEEIRQGTQMGVLSIAIVADLISGEMTPQILTAPDAMSLNSMVQASVNNTNAIRKYWSIPAADITKHAKLNYDALTKHTLAAISDIDTRSVVSIIGEIIYEDILNMKDYITNVARLDRNRLMFERLSVPSTDGVIVKDNNVFDFPSGFQYKIKSFMVRPDRSWDWDYDIELGNEAMRGAKRDDTFISKDLNQDKFNTNFNGNTW